MKKLFALLIVLIIGGNSLYAQCDKLFDFKEGTTWEWTNYDKKGKVVSKTNQKVDKVETIDNGLKITLTSVISDENGEVFPPVSMDMICENGVVYYDMKKFVPDQYLNDPENETSIKIEGTNLEMPGDMKAGDILKDASVKMTIGGTGSPMAINMTVDVINRKVEAEESLTTPAGEFDCTIITQTVKTKLMMTFQMDSKEWYSPGVGMVKSESLKKGKLQSYSLLTAFSK